jgi:plastocyanin
VTLSRRSVLQIAGGFLGGLPFRSASLAKAEPADITMAGNKDGSKVWFEPIGLLVRPGQTVRWTNQDAGNAHTSTAYHPANDEHSLRIPEGAAPWDSDYLLPDQSFSVTLTAPGVYDYYCIPHEHAGMVGRIVVADGAQPIRAPGAAGVPQAAARAFPSIEDILRDGRVFGD